MLWAFPESGQDIRLPDTEQTGTRWDRQRGPGWQAQAATRKKDEREGVKADKGWEGEPGHRSSPVPGITASVPVMSGAYQAHASYHGDS